jgi:hypothetical protein
LLEAVEFLVDVHGGGCQVSIGDARLGMANDATAGDMAGGGPAHRNKE